MLVTFNERKARYGLNYLMIGKVMAALFPDGYTLKTEDDWNKMHLYLMMMVKATRLANTNLTHEDSCHDSAVYASMLNGLLLPDEKPSVTGLVDRPCCASKQGQEHTSFCVNFKNAGYTDGYLKDLILKNSVVVITDSNGSKNQWCVYCNEKQSLELVGPTTTEFKKLKHLMTCITNKLNGLLPGEEDVPHHQVNANVLRVCCDTLEDAIHKRSCVFSPKEQADPRENAEPFFGNRS
jgi:hypothetical protein